MNSQQSADGHVLYVNADATMVHTAACPHRSAAAAAALTAASDEQVTTLPVCTSCAAILDGWRRTTYDSLDNALEAYQAPVENRPRLREIAAELAYTSIWIPASGSYIALGGADAAAAYFGKGYADIHLPEGGYRRIELPYSGNAGNRAGGSAAGRAPAVMCDTCHTQLPATGVCDTCA